MTTQVSVGGKIDEEGYARPIYANFKEGVAGGLSTDALKVVQRGAGANMSVDTTVGSVFIGTPESSTTHGYWGWVHTAASNTAVDASDPSNPRKDIVVAYIDLATISTSVTDNTGALKFDVVPGTPAGSPADPSDATIQTAVGASNPWIKLARVDVAAGASSISDANITDLRASLALRSPLSPVISALSATTAGSYGHDVVTMDASGGARTFTLPDATLQSGRIFTIIKIDATNVVTIATTSSQTIAHPGGGAPVQTALINQYDRIKVMSNGSNWLIVEDGRSPLLTSASTTTAFTTTSSANTVSGARLTTISPLTVTIPAGYKYEVLFYCVDFYNNQAGNVSIIDIWDGDNTAGGTELIQANHDQVTGVDGQGSEYIKTAPLAALATNTSKSFYFTAHAPAGSTTTTVNAGAGTPYYAEVRLIK